jgi:hypothetical protein
MDEEREKEASQKKTAEGALERPSPTSASIHSGLTEGEEETPADKKIRGKEKVHEKKNDVANKK